MTKEGDLISRQAVLDELEKWDWQDLYLPIHFKQILDDVPSVENKGEWIPVSERLPKIHQDVLLELRSGEMLTGFKAETEPYFYCHGVDGCYVEPQNVLAWQTLPAPYKAESEEV